ncbi:DUF3592 domain-containing protein [Actinacidiphila yeochonensis]|uniref:DUF3592 domain-containing protein n=1 Tax=Actinacidiphila yeochonensis TaxID=89050 RepID=UPI00056D3AE6|nr:DUF3592 domain-containing protein [Actinacidiphila yeochonensis]
MGRKVKRDDWTRPGASDGTGSQEVPLRARVAAGAPKRGLIAVLLVFSVLCFGMFFAFRSDCGSTVDALRDHGTQKVAFVEKAGTNKYGQHTDVQVSFEDAAGTHHGNLCVPSGGSLPKGLAKGSAVAVVYDSRKPSRVMLASQVAHPPGWSVAMVVTLAGGVLFLGLGAAVALRRRQVLRGG